MNPGVEVYRQTEDGYSVDRPSLGRYREPMAGSLPDGLAAVAMPPTIDSQCGWYETENGTVLLTQIPEMYWGEPMVMLASGDTVSRAYATGEHTFIAEDGLVLDTLKTQRSLRYRESGVDFDAGGITLSGTIITPAGPGPFPAAVMLHGSAGGQRDYMRIFATPVLAAGVAVLIFDKRAHGRSGGDEEPTIFDQADAASAALDVLARTPCIESGRRGLIGFSNGMWAAPAVAARRTDVAFLAGVGAPGVSAAEAEVHRRTKVLRDCGVGDETIAVVEAVWRTIFGMAARGAASPDDVNDLAGLLATLSTADDLSRYTVPDYVRQNPMLAPYPPPEVPAEAIVAMVTAQADPELVYDPAADYARLTCPIYLQYGSNDVSVPVPASVEAVSAVRPDADIRIYAGLEHQLNVAPRPLDGLTSEEAQYLFHDFRFGPGVRDDLTAWLRKVAYA